MILKPSTAPHLDNPPDRRKLRSNRSSPPTVPGCQFSAQQLVSLQSGCQPALDSGLVFKWLKNLNENRHIKITRVAELIVRSARSRHLRRFRNSKPPKRRSAVNSRTAIFGCMTIAVLTGHCLGPKRLQTWSNFITLSHLTHRPLCSNLCANKSQTQSRNL